MSQWLHLVDTYNQVTKLMSPALGHTNTMCFPIICTWVTQCHFCDIPARTVEMSPVMRKLWTAPNGGLPVLFDKVKVGLEGIGRSHNWRQTWPELDIEAEKEWLTVCVLLLRKLIIRKINKCDLQFSSVMGMSALDAPALNVKGSHLWVGSAS